MRRNHPRPTATALLLAAGLWLLPGPVLAAAHDREPARRQRSAVRLLLEPVERLLTAVWGAIGGDLDPNG